MQSNEISNLRENEHFRKEFIGNLAHELKTPLHNIQGFILTLIEGAYEDPEISHKFLTKAAKNVERMTGLIEDLDAISRIESGILGLRIQEFDAIELARDTIESLEPKAKRAEITLSLHPDTPRSLVVLGDSTTIGQVLTNLVVNSITYGRPHGSTTLRIIARDEYAVFEVSDTGIGISEEDLPRIFERFYRVDKSRSRQAGGSGLGLAIVKHLIEAHGQHIHVKSTVGEGTSFTFRLRRPG
jgi:two-component system phosphate regulon sensor histidine kinase PhoR